MSLDLEEQEQLENIKAWWAKYGLLLSAVLIGLILGVIGIQVYQHYRTQISERAATQYDQAVNAVQSNDLPKLQASTTALQNDYPRSVYAAWASLQLAKVQLEKSEPQAKVAAQSSLQWIVDHSKDANIVAIARIRLAGILLDQNKIDDGLKVLETSLPDAYQALASDRRGDLYVAKGDLSRAREAYELALAKLDSKSTLKTTLELKRDSIPVNDFPAAAASNSPTNSTLPKPVK